MKKRATEKQRATGVNAYPSEHSLDVDDLPLIENHWSTVRGIAVRARQLVRDMAGRRPSTGP